MISFAGFSQTTTDLCQDSNLELVASADVDVISIQGVVDSIVVGESIVNETVSVSSYEMFGTDSYDEAIIQNISEPERRGHAIDELTKQNHAQKRTQKPKLADNRQRLARDGFNYIA